MGGVLSTIDIILGRERVENHLACFGACDRQPHIPLEGKSLQHHQLPGCMAYIASTMPCYLAT